MSQQYEELKKSYVKGWRTWNNTSVLSFVHMPEGLGIRLGLKDYKAAKLLENIRIGDLASPGKVIPYAHTYDGSYIEMQVIFENNILQIQTGIEKDDLVMLVTPLQQPYKASSLLINGILLWNREGTVEKCTYEDENWLCLKNSTCCIPIYTTASHNGEFFTEFTSPYLSVNLDQPVGISSGRKRSVEEIQVILKEKKQKWEDNKAKYGELAECYNAMQTCQAWDTIYNPQNEVPITTVSRNWNRSDWGGYVLFCWDTYFGAAMQALDDKELAYFNAIEMTKAVTPDGFVPNYSCQNGYKSFDRSQPPVGSMTCLQIYEKYQERWFLEEVFDNLFSWNTWYFEHRMTSNGLLAWGSDPCKSLYDQELGNWGIHDRQGAAFESGLDNSPMYDEIPFDKERNQLCLDDVGLTGLYINDCHCLGKIAGILGRSEQAAVLSERAVQMEEKMEELWDEDFGMYVNRRTDTGEYQYRLTPFHFHALFSRKVGQERAERMIREHMRNPKEFWGEYILPSVARNDPAYPDNNYWRGRIWAPMNYLVYMALAQYDLSQTKKELAEKSKNLILKEWLRDGHVHENYNADTGEGCDVQNSDPFYHWGGLLALIALMEFGS